MRSAQWGLLAAIDADLVRFIAYPIIKGQQLVHHFEPGDGERFVDDVFLSPNGTTLYVSRSNLGDIAAFDLARANHPLKWKTWVDGLKADHATISPDGTKLVVSATTASVADMIDTQSGKLTGSFTAGTYPHHPVLGHDEPQWSVLLCIAKWRQRRLGDRLLGQEADRCRAGRQIPQRGRLARVPARVIEL